MRKNHRFSGIMTEAEILTLQSKIKENTEQLKLRLEQEKIAAQAAAAKNPLRRIFR